MARCSSLRLRLAASRKLPIISSCSITILLSLQKHLRRRNKRTAMEILHFLILPFLASMILTGIHAYLGVHVVERGVIFVDLALAQIAELGATVALRRPFSGGGPHSGSVYCVSLLFTFRGAFIFSMIRVKDARIPQEAFI